MKLGTVRCFLGIGVISAIFCVADAQDTSQKQVSKRAKLLEILKGCSTRPITRGCSEDTAIQVIDLYRHGDKTVLPALLDAGLTGDGALTEALGDFYAEAVMKNTREFLQGLVPRSEKDQRKLSRLTGLTDGSGMAGKELREIRSKLNRITSSKADPLAKVARICLEEIVAVNKVTK